MSLLINPGSTESYNFDGVSRVYIPDVSTFERTSTLYVKAKLKVDPGDSNENSVIWSGEGPASTYTGLLIFGRGDLSGSWKGSLWLQLMSNNAASNRIIVYTDDDALSSSVSRTAEIWYDGSSTAAGVTMAIDDVSANINVLTDNLTASTIASTPGAYIGVRKYNPVIVQASMVLDSLEMTQDNILIFKTDCRSNDYSHICKDLSGSGNDGSINTAPGGDLAFFGPLPPAALLKVPSIEKLLKFSTDQPKFNNTSFSNHITNDNTYYVGGNFTKFGDVSCNRLAKFNKYGIFDKVFAGNVSNNGGPNNFVWTIKTDASGYLLIGGRFTTWNDVSTYGYIRLKPNGEVDPLWNPTWGWSRFGYSQVLDYKQDPNSGEYWIIGNFEYFGSFEDGGAGIAKIDNHGQKIAMPDMSNGFYSAGGDQGAGDSLIIKPDSSVLLLGTSFVTTYNGVSNGGIVLIDSNGKESDEYDTNMGIPSGDGVADSGLYDSINEYYYISGNFKEINNQTQHLIMKISKTGVIDQSWCSSTAFLQAGFEHILDIHLYEDGKTLLTGNFQQFELDTTKRNMIRLDPSGNYDSTLDISLGFNNAIYNNFVDVDGKILASGVFSSFLDENYPYVGVLTSTGEWDEHWNDHLK